MVTSQHVDYDAQREHVSERSIYQLTYLLRALLLSHVLSLHQELIPLVLTDMNDDVQGFLVVRVPVKNLHAMTHRVVEIHLILSVLLRGFCFSSSRKENKFTYFTSCILLTIAARNFVKSIIHIRSAEPLQNSVASKTNIAAILDIIRTTRLCTTTPCPPFFLESII